MEKELRKSYYTDAMTNYLILKCPASALEGYQYRMLAANRIQGLLPCSMRSIDGDSYLYYEITSRQSLARLYDHGQISGKEMQKILYSIADMFRSLAEYLLDQSRLFMDPEYIFYDFEADRYCFTYYPEKIDDQGIRSLMEYLADKSDPHGADSAAVIYHLCDLASHPGFILRTELLDHEYEQVQLQIRERQESVIRGTKEEVPADHNPERSRSDDWVYRDAGETESGDAGYLQQDRKTGSFVDRERTSKEEFFTAEKENVEGSEDRSTGMRKSRQKAGKERSAGNILILAAGSLAASGLTAIITFTADLSSEWIMVLRAAVFAGLTIAAVTAVYGLNFLHKRNREEQENIRRQQEEKRRNAMVPAEEFPSDSGPGAKVQMSADEP